MSKLYAAKKYDVKWSKANGLSDDKLFFYELMKMIDVKINGISLKGKDFSDRNWHGPDDFEISVEDWDKVLDALHNPPDYIMYHLSIYGYNQLELLNLFKTYKDEADLSDKKIHFSFH